MSLPESDLVRLRHMLEASEHAIEFCLDRQRPDLDTDAMLRFALLHLVMIVGEAASKVSQATRTLLPELPWQGAVGMRHRLVHAYFDADADVLWTSVTESLPELVRQLKDALANH